MGSNTLWAGTALMSLLLVLAWLPPKEALTPSRGTLLLLGVAGGIVSVLAFTALRWSAPELHVAAYPTAAAFLALFFSPPAALVAALMALAAVVWADPQGAAPATAVLGVAVASAMLWRLLAARTGVPPWAAVVGLTFTLPLAVALGLWAGSGGADTPTALP